ncbi:MAG: cache domain-containing protein [Xanthobacteraceae bacterium]
MLRILALFTALLTCTAVFAAEPEHGTREQAVAMVKSVEAMFSKAGADATFKAVTAQKFKNLDLYPFIYTLDGTDCVAHGANPALVGKNLIDMKDQDGKFLIRELSVMAKKGGGWVDYKWPNPVTKMIEAKSAYVERMGNYFVGVGVYH